MSANQLWIFTAVLIALLLASCTQIPPETQPTQPDATTVPTTAPATASTTVPPTEAPTDPPMPDWMREPVYPSYEELFSEDRKYESYAEKYYEAYDPCSWFVMDGSTGVKFSAKLINATGSTQIYIYSEAKASGSFVWKAENQRPKTLLGCDGRYAYVMDAEYSAEGLCRILQVDMLAETAKTVAEADFFPDAYLSCDAVLYYVAYAETDDKVSIHRVYLPEMKDELLLEPDVPVAKFNLLPPESTLGDICWHSLSQKIQPLLKTVLSDPNSEFCDVRSKILWEEEGAVWDPVRAEAFDYLCGVLYSEKYVEVYDRYCYNLEADTVTVRTLDRVPMLAGYEPSACVLSSWEPLTNADIQDTLIGGTPSQKLQPILEGDGFYPGKLYLLNQGTVTAVIDKAFLQVQGYEDAVYCVTEDHKILQIDYDGRIYNTLYTSDCDTLEIWGYYDKHLYIREDNRFLDLDLVELKYRTLLSFNDGKIAYGYYRMSDHVLMIDVHKKDAVYVHTFDIIEEAFIDAREFSNYGDTVSEVA